MFSPLDAPALIYEARNRINGKRYIGVTGQGLKKRRRQHIRDALAGKGQGAFAHALRKYGQKGFRWRVLSRYKTGRDAIVEERRLILETSPEYNSTFGGEGFSPTIFTEESLQRMIAPHWGNRYRSGKTHTKATRRKLRKIGLRDKDGWLLRSHLGPQTLAKRVQCVDDAIIYESASEAARAYGAAKSTVIEVCLHKKYRHSAAGCVFRYVDRER